MSEPIAVCRASSMLSAPTVTTVRGKIDCPRRIEHRAHHAGFACAAGPSPYRPGIADDAAGLAVRGERRQRDFVAAVPADQFGRCCRPHGCGSARRLVVAIGVHADTSLRHSARCASSGSSGTRRRSGSPPRHKIARHRLAPSCAGLMLAVAARSTLSAGSPSAIRSPARDSRAHGKSPARSPPGRHRRPPRPLPASIDFDNRPRPRRVPRDTARCKSIGGPPAWKYIAPSLRRGDGALLVRQHRPPCDAAAR